MAFNPRDFARQEIEGFFRRRDERGKCYCAGCLVEQLTQRGSRDIVSGTWTAAVEDAFERLGRLRVKPSHLCGACKKRRRCIGAPRPGP